MASPPLRRVVAILTGLLLGGCADHPFDNPLDPDAAADEIQVLAVYQIAAQDPWDLAWDGLSVVVVDAAAAKAILLDPLTASEQRGMYSPGDSMRGVASNGTDYYVLDPLRSRAYRLSAGGGVLASFSISARDAVAADLTGDSLWVLDRDSATIHQIEIPGGQEVATLKTAVRHPTGLLVRPDHIWLSAESEGRVYRLSRSAGTVEAVLDAPGSNPRGLAFDGEHLWIVDRSGTLFKTRLG
ncbi:MAG: hypothetical protein HYV63_14285 [Candidatus Schekmanbacteria bacterium]|nr:hypothetical protein [Candidatus Schekmanbacteria bacterium]